MARPVTGKKLSDPADVDEVTGRKRPPPDADAYSIAEFCRRHMISVAHYYRLPEEERPSEMKVGHRKLISKEAAKVWRRQRQTAAKDACRTETESTAVANAAP